MKISDLVLALVVAALLFVTIGLAMNDLGGTGSTRIMTSDYSKQIHHKAGRIQKGGNHGSASYN